MQEVLLDTLLDTLKAMPILLCVYVLIEFLEARVDVAKLFGGKFERFGPLFGALAGSIPQCGFSAAAATLYQKRVLSAATLIAVFLSTSDEAIPVMLANMSDWKTILLLLVSKLVLAAGCGYLLRFTVFRKSKPGNSPQKITVEADGCGCCEHTHGRKSFWYIFLCALKHTLQISAFIGVSILAINVFMYFIGEERLSSILLSGSIFQPAITALIGLIPGCATSVLLTQLFLGGSISFGAAVAGLSTGAGFGYLVLMKNCRDKKEALKILLWTYLCSAIAGTLLQFLMQ